MKRFTTYGIMLCFAAGSLCSMTAFMPAEKKQVAGNSGIGDTTAYRDLYEDTWVATDALGRQMPSFDEVGPVKNDQRRRVMAVIIVG